MPTIRQPVSEPEKHDLTRGKSGSAVALITRRFVRHGGQPGTHPKRLVRYKREVRDRRLLFPPFSSYTRVPDKLSVCKHGFQLNGYVRRRIFRLPARQADAKAATQRERLRHRQSSPARRQSRFPATDGLVAWGRG